jgi:hypothetical protein
MNRQRHLANPILWAVAIIASALLGAPTVLCVILLPSLAMLSLRAQSRASCFNRSELS